MVKKKNISPYKKKNMKWLKTAKNILKLGAVVGLGLGAKKIYDTYKKDRQNVIKTQPEILKITPQPIVSQPIVQPTLPDKKEEDLKYLKDIKAEAITLLKELGKTKKEMIKIDKLLVQIMTNNNKTIEQDVCMLYDIILDEITLECEKLNKSYGSDVKRCVVRSLNKMDMVKVKKATSQLKCK